jgi:hypothetical protein
MYEENRTKDVKFQINVIREISSFEAIIRADNTQEMNQRHSSRFWLEIYLPATHCVPQQNKQCETVEPNECTVDFQSLASAALARQDTTRFLPQATTNNFA